MNYLWIGLGSALGGMARAWVGSWVEQRNAGNPFPWGIFLVNFSGSLLIGLLAGAAQADVRWLANNPTATSFLMVGVCGGYTTFSTFSLQTFNLLRSGRTGTALAYMAASVVLCVLAVWLGFLITNGLKRS